MSDINLAVTEVLRGRGYQATFEYPGFVAVTVGTREYSTSDANETWTVDVHARTPTASYSELLGSYDTEVSRTEPDPQKIADALIQTIEKDQTTTLQGDRL